MNPTDIYCFSGTGNTLLVARKIRDIFNENNVKTRLRPLEKSDPGKVDLTRTLGLAFPVAAQSTYPLVWKFCENLPEAKGTDVFMVDTLAAFSGGVVGPLKKLFVKKGYNPIGAREIIMPSNYALKKINEEKKNQKIEKGLKKTEDFARDLLSGKAAWPRGSIFAGFFYWMSRSSFMWKMLRKFMAYEVDRKKCTRCQTCVKLCPVENIRMDEFPVFLNRCELCQRCISFCPEGAISVKGKDYARYRAVKAAELSKEEPS